MTGYSVSTSGLGVSYGRTAALTDVTIDLTVWDLKHLSAIISELREKRVISRVERVVA